MAGAAMRDRLADRLLDLARLVRTAVKQEDRDRAAAELERLATS